MNRQTTRLLALGLKAIIQQPKLIQVILFWIPFITGLGLIIGGGYYFYENKIAQPKMSYMGVPITQNNWQNLTHTLRNEGYMLGYSERLKNPLWVIYKVTNNKKKYAKRPHFSADWRSLSYITTDDYKYSGFNRGHLAPNYIIASRYGKQAQKETFLMTNISPQKPKFNQKIWQRLEEVSANHFSKQFKTFWVVTGPIFTENPKKLKTTNIAIPKAFYKIFIAPSADKNKIKSLAFIMPQSARPKDSLIKYVTSIDEVEKQTGIDFFWQLDDKAEQKLEQQQDFQPWKLKRVANLPSRY
jgi:endonuclease G